MRAARMAAQRGATVAVAELAQMGGTCVNLGCIPKKLYSYAAHYAEAFHEARGFGWSFPQAPAFDWPTLKRQRAKEISRLNEVYGGLLTTNKVQIYNGRASLVDAHTVEVNGRRHTSRHILVATGGTPYVPEFVGREHVLTSDGMFDLATFPKRLLVVGAGYIACEFASIFNGLGSKVVQVHRGAAVLKGFDDDVRGFVADELRESGIDLRLSSGINEITKSGGTLEATLTDGSRVCADAVLYATGRVPNTQGLGLAAAGVAVGEHGKVIVDDRFRSSVPSIYAVGDVSSRVHLTPVALAEAMVVVDQLFGTGQRRMSHEYVPSAVFTHPNVATVGYSEADARSRFGDIRVYRSTFRPLKHTLSGRNTRALMKLVVDAATDKVVGLHMVGEEAGEIVQGFAVAIRAGATKELFDSTIGIHPTAAEEFVTMREAVKT